MRIHGLHSVVSHRENGQRAINTTCFIYHGRPRVFFLPSRRSVCTYGGAALVHSYVSFPRSENKTLTFRSLFTRFSTYPFSFFLSSWNYSGQTLLSDSASFVSIVGGAQKLVSIAIRERIFSLLLRSLRIGRRLSFVICVKIFSPFFFSNLVFNWSENYPNILVI